MKPNHRTWVASGLALAAMLMAPAAFAVDGVAEINQACAAQLGCFPGDGPGFPVTIDGSVGTSYRLTSDLVVPAGKGGIFSDARSIDLDLNGFRIVVADCATTTDPACTSPSPFGDGVAITGRGASVRNGSVISMGGDGISLGDDASIVNVRALENGARGITAGGAARIRDCLAGGNGTVGIYAGTAIVTGSLAYDNGEEGIRLGFANASGNIAYNNGDDGIRVTDHSVVIGNAVQLSGDRGIDAFNSVVHDNSSTFNTSFSISNSTAGGLRGNVTDSPTLSGVQLGNNTCDGAICP